MQSFPVPAQPAAARATDSRRGTMTSRVSPVATSRMGGKVEKVPCIFCFLMQGRGVPIIIDIPIGQIPSISLVFVVNR